MRSFLLILVLPDPSVTNPFPLLLHTSHNMRGRLLLTHAFFTFIQFNFVHGLGRIKIIARNVKAVLSLLVQGEIRETILETCVPLGGLHWSEMGQNHNFLKKKALTTAFWGDTILDGLTSQGAGTLNFEANKIATFCMLPFHFGP